MDTITLEMETGRLSLQARREFLRVGAAAVARCRHEQLPIAVALVCAATDDDCGGDDGDLCRHAVERLASYVGRNCITGHTGAGEYALVMPGVNEEQAERVFVSLLDTVMAALARSHGGRWSAPAYAIADLHGTPGSLEHALAHLRGELALADVAEGDAASEPMANHGCDFAPTVAMPLSRF